MDIRVLEYLLIALAFSIPLSISVAEPLAFLAVGVWGVTLRHRERRDLLRTNVLLIPLAAFILYTVIFSLGWGVRPLRSLDKFHRLLFLLLPFIAEAGLLRRLPHCSEQKLREALLAFVAGATLLGLYDLVRVPLYAVNGGDLYDAGNMRDPQFYLVSLCLLAAFWVTGPAGRVRLFWLASLFLNAAGLLLHFKRGVWMAAITAMLILAVRARRWRILALVVLCAGAMLLLPQVRQRLAHLKEVGTVRLGGRYVLWTETMPALYEAYPAGMGWCAVTHQDFVDHSENFVQEKLNHLHNNVLQIRLELGWCGVALWTIIMGSVLVLFLRSGPALPASCGWMNLGLFSAFCGLLLNGLVEFNFGDTEIMMLYCLLMGFAVILRRISKSYAESEKRKL
jgi:hypothetical protein